MTDMIDEWWTQLAAIEEARVRGGCILVTGLGLGLVAEAIFAAPVTAVERLTIVERSDDVIRLVAPTLLERYPDRLEIIVGDAFTWTPPAGMHYSVVWHDIWPNARDSACREEIERLKARYAPWCDWQGAWTLPE
jgi:spermidine synthase